MQRLIIGWRQDDIGDWIALLDCGHRQHVRHRPPLWPKPWVDEEEGRAARTGTPLECPLCDRGEPPDPEVLEVLVAQRRPAGEKATTGAKAEARVETEPQTETGAETEGGDPACFAHLVCPSCDAVAGDPAGHAPGCPEAGTAEA